MLWLYFLKFALKCSGFRSWHKCLLYFVACFTWAWNWACHIKGWTWLKVFKFRVWRKIFGHQREEVMEGCRKCIMRNFMICIPHHIYYSCDHIKSNEMTGACCMHGKKRSVWKLLVWKRPPGRHRCKWKDNIKMNVKEIE
jgi:hypothetical protein